MSKSDLNKVYKIQMPVLKMDSYVITSHSFNATEKELIVMISISDKEEEKLDSGRLTCTRDNIVYTIDSSNVICYGEIDFSDNSDDFLAISAMNWLDHLKEQGIAIPSNYSYKEHCCYSPTKFARFYDTTNPAAIAQYIHACIGKPKRVCIFKERKKKWK